MTLPRCSAYYVSHFRTSVSDNLYSLFLAPPEQRTSLRPDHIQDAFARMQGDWAQRRSAGMRNWRGGLIRTTVSLI